MNIIESVHVVFILKFIPKTGFIQLFYIYDNYEENNPDCGGAACRERRSYRTTIDNKK